MKQIMILAVAALLLTSCTDNTRTRNFGGSMNRALPAGNKLVVATRKDSDLWLLYRPMRPGEQPETWTFKEESAFGIMRGTVIIQEAK